MSNSSSDSETDFKKINRLVDGTTGKQHAAGTGNPKSENKDKNEKAKKEEMEEEEDEEEGEEEEDGEYDLMEYGDEFNDEEERRYAKEMYGQGAASGRPKRKVLKELSEESEPRAPVESLAKSFSRRANRGLKMNALVTKALEVDEDQDDFWGGLGADYFGIKNKKDDRKNKGQLEDSEEADENDLLEGMLADDD